MDGTGRGHLPLNKIREVFPGTTANPTQEYVELQSDFPGQNLLSGHSLVLYDSSGFMVNSVPLTNVTNADSQRTVLIASSAYTGATPDITWSPANDYFDAGGGAVCFDSVDCMSWGTSTSFFPALTSPAGTNAAAIADGQALRRTIAPGCPTLLEAADDTDNSLTDFSAVTPNPRNNASVPTETGCTPPPGGDTKAPDTDIDSVKVKSEKRTAKVRFSGSDDQGGKLTFECKLDDRDFKLCKSPEKYEHQKPGKHKVSVRAIDAAGNVDKSPATDRFKVKD